MQTRKNVYTLLIEEAGKLVFPEKVDIVRKNNKQNLYNDVIDYLLKNELGWTKDSRGQNKVNVMYCNDRVNTIILRSVIYQ